MLSGGGQNTGVEDLETKALTGDDGPTLIFLAPYGVIGSIAPSTNPGRP